jgi:site-specific DNA recombinase
MQKGVLYVRVSSKEQKEEGYSIPAQKKLLREYARKNSIEVVQEFEEVETAKKAGRCEFESMLKFLKKHVDVENILVEKTDRLTRNLRDAVSIDDLKRTLHFVKEGVVIGPNARHSDKLMYGIKLVLAKSYLDLLSEETSKGMLEKAEQGLYPSWAPLGYVNNKGTKGIDVDFMRAGIIRELFEIYSKGNVSLRELADHAYRKGLRTRAGKKLHIFLIERMLKNPVYIGDFVWKGVYYKGKHDAILSRELFERVQRVIGSRKWARGKGRRELALRGLLKCGRCGCVITGERKKEKYVYYHCTHARGKCPGKPVREEELALMVGEPLKRLRITNERLEWIKRALAESFRDQKDYKAKEIEKLQIEYKEIEDKISKMYEDKLAGVIPERFWKSKYREYQSRQSKILQCVEEHQKAGGNYLEDSSRILELAQKAYSLYVAQDSFEKRKLLDLLLWNSVLKDGKVISELRKPFDILADGAEEEEKQAAQNVPFEARSEIWLPKRNPLTNHSPFLTTSPGGPHK